MKLAWFSANNFLAPPKRCLNGALLAAMSAVALPVEAEPALPEVPVFRSSGESAAWTDVLAAMDKADIVLIGEAHTDSRGHELQRKLIEVAGERWDNVILSLEEFDRSQQAALDGYAAGELTDAELKAERDFVDPRIKKNWEQWFLPKIKAGRAAGANLIASNAPLKYSRMARNLGCDNLPDMPPEERALFDCPAAELNAEYLDRFNARMASVSRQNKRSGLKEIGPEQTERMFRAQRVWDATMAGSITTARSNTDGKVIHLVGSFHCDFNGGLIDELQHREPEARILVITLTPKRSGELLAADKGRADFVIYTRG